MKEKALSRQMTYCAEEAISKREKRQKIASRILSISSVCLFAASVYIVYLVSSICILLILKRNLIDLTTQCQFIGIIAIILAKFAFFWWMIGHPFRWVLKKWIEGKPTATGVIPSKI